LGGLPKNDVPRFKEEHEALYERYWRDANGRRFKQEGSGLFTEIYPPVSPMIKKDGLELLAVIVYGQL
jgi:hypothetical protein